MSTQSIRPVSVVVADDHPIWLRALARDLEEAGFDAVTTAVDGEPDPGHGPDGPRSRPQPARDAWGRGLSGSWGPRDPGAHPLCER